MQRQTKFRVLYAAILLFVLAVIAPPLIQINRFRNNLTDSLSRALGRSVACGDIHLHLLPRPGFDITNLTIADDPSYGAEPILVAGEVIADLRLASFWRRRIEIAHLSLKYPSLNVAKRSDGHWNIETLLVRAAQIKTAPTSKTQAEERPRFPYIEVSTGRINFRDGVHKLALAITEADFALWLESENMWNIRMKARPMRTDANLTDTGSVVVNGSFGRAEVLRSIPLDLNVQIDKMQLGQLSTLLLGHDKGWRGEISSISRFSGSIGNTVYNSNLLVHGFHRYDIQMSETVDLPFSCSGRLAVFSATENADYKQVPSGIECATTLSGGEMKVSSMPVAQGNPNNRLHLQTLHLPVSTLVPIIKQMKYALPSDLLGTGTLNGDFVLQHDDHAWTWNGRGTLNDVLLQSQIVGQQVKVASITFGSDCVYELVDKSKQTVPQCVSRLVHPTRLQHTKSVHFDPFAITSSANGSITIQGELNETGTYFHLKGVGSAKTLAAQAQMLGLSTNIMYLDGSVIFDLRLNHNWIGFSPAHITGTVQLKKNTISMPTSAATIEIRNANIDLKDETTSIKGIDVALQGTKTTVQGDITLPRDCTLSTCTMMFALKTNGIDLSHWDPLLVSQTTLSSQASRVEDFFILFKETKWFGQRAKGTLHAGLLSIDGVQIKNTKTTMDWKDSKLTFSEINGAVKMLHKPSWSNNFDGVLPNSHVLVEFLSPKGKPITLKDVLEHSNKQH